MSISTSFSIQVGKEPENQVSVEVDARPLPDGLNAQYLGKTSDWDLNEEIIVLLYPPPDYAGVEIYFNYKDEPDAYFKSTSQTTRVKCNDSIEFNPGVKTGKLSKRAVPSTFKRCSWMGSDLGSLTLEPDAVTVKLSGSASTAVKPKYGVAIVGYETEAVILKLKMPPLSRMKKFGNPPYEVKGLIAVSMKGETDTKSLGVCGGKNS